ncbi:yippee-like protein, partial [Cutaneotrichosporon oleaginosum]
MGRSYRTYLAGETVYVCRGCGNHLAVQESVMSRNFTGQHGRAYLCRHVVNVYTSAEAEDRTMRTGKHTVRDLYCSVCHHVLGWKYDFAYEPGEKYKEGKFIIEREMIVERPEGKRNLDKPVIEEVVVRQV